MISKTKRSGVQKRILHVIVSIPIFAMGMGLIYFAYLEISPVFLFIYLSLGLAMVVIGTQIFISGIKNKGLGFGDRSDTNKWEESTIEQKYPAEDDTKGGPEKCPSCGAEITSAGKFCGSCGKIL